MTRMTTRILFCPPCLYHQLRSIHLHISVAIAVDGLCVSAPSQRISPITFINLNLSNGIARRAVRVSAAWCLIRCYIIGIHWKQIYIALESISLLQKTIIFPRLCAASEIFEYISQWNVISLGFEREIREMINNENDSHFVFQISTHPSHKNDFLEWLIISINEPLMFINFILRVIIYILVKFSKFEIHC